MVCHHTYWKGNGVGVVYGARTEEIIYAYTCLAHCEVTKFYPTTYIRLKYFSSTLNYCSNNLKKPVVCKEIMCNSYIYSETITISR